MNQKNTHRDNSKSIMSKIGKFLTIFFILSFIICLSSYIIIQTTNTSMANTKQRNKPLFVQKTFTVQKKQQLFSTESVSYTTPNAIWSLDSEYGDFSNQNETYTAFRSQSTALDVQQNHIYQSVKTINGKAAPDTAPDGPWRKVAPLAPGNKYAPGNCTWYAYNRRAFIGKPIGSFWGNGGNWHNSAKRAGFKVNHTPKVGDVIDMPHHVAIVEAVGDKDTVYISEMNLGWILYSYGHRWIANASKYWFIH